MEGWYDAAEFKHRLAQGVGRAVAVGSRRLGEPGQLDSCFRSSSDRIGLELVAEQRMGRAVGRGPHFDHCAVDRGAHRWQEGTSIVHVTSDATLCHELGPDLVHLSGKDGVARLGVRTGLKFSVMEATAEHEGFAVFRGDISGHLFEPVFRLIRILIG